MKNWAKNWKSVLNIGKVYERVQNLKELLKSAKKCDLNVVVFGERNFSHIC